MNIRNMIIADYENLYQLWINTKGMGLNTLDDSKEGIEKYLKRNANTCFVAEEEDNSIIGAVLAGHDGRRGFLYHTVVEEKMQRQGIGKMLVSRAIEALKEEGINKVALVVFSKNIRGNRFWDDLGFTSREDLIYRNKSMVKLERIDT